MTIAQAIQTTKIDPRENELLLMHVLKCNQIYLRTHGDNELTSTLAKRYTSLVARRLQHEPIAYITGFQPFCGHDFFVNQHTLIPRPETENLTEMIIRYAQEQHLKQPSIIDIGTGSGCLAITLGRAISDAKMIASDVSDKALLVARKNSKNIGASVIFIKDNLFGEKLIKAVSKVLAKQTNYKDKLKIKPLIFVANLPYLPTIDKKTMQPDVVRFEPAKALFAGKDGMTLLLKLLKQIKNFVSNQKKHTHATDLPMLPFQYSIFLEIDPSQSTKLKEISHVFFPDHHIDIKHDLCGRNRFLTITPSNN